MSTHPPTCPYCNAQAPPAASGKVTCPRCDEVFTLANAPPTGIQTAPASMPTPIRPSPGKPIRANRIVAGVILSVMAVMAATGLTYALMTVAVRREHDKALPRRSRKPFEIFRKAQPEPDEAVPPIQWAGLGYLPPGTAVVAGVQVKELLRSPAGKEMGGKGIKIGGFELTLDAVKERLGLDAQEIDHVVLGMTPRAGRGRSDATGAPRGANEQGV